MTLASVGLDCGTDFSGLDGSPVFPFVQIQFEWDEKDLSYVLPYGPPPLELPTSSKWAVTRPQPKSALRTRQPKPGRKRLGEERRWTQPRRLLTGLDPWWCLSAPCLEDAARADCATARRRRKEAQKRQPQRRCPEQAVVLDPRNETGRMPLSAWPRSRSRLRRAPPAAWFISRLHRSYRPRAVRYHER